jgi:hypothetical protein
MLAADAKWSACMRSAGYDFDTPDDAASAAWPEAPDEAELAVAKRDVACKQHVMWLETWRAAEAARQTLEARSNVSALKRIAAALADRDARARAVLGAASRTPKAQQS